MPDPFARGPGRACTGPATWRAGCADGRLEFLARLDHQVKVRGFRIELGEIEAALARHPAVRRAVVVAREDAAGENAAGRLRRGRAPGAEPHGHGAAQASAGQRCPEYMVPAAFVSLDALPLTPNGKVDRKALRRPEARRAGRRGHVPPPRTPTEAVLAELWREVLSVERIGLRDNFFDLGGHSLLAMQVIARVEKGIGASPEPARHHLPEPRAARRRLRSARPVTSRSRRRRGPDGPPADTVRVTIDGGRGA